MHKRLLKIAGSKFVSMDLVGKSDPIAIVYQKRLGNWIEVGRTEVIKYVIHTIHHMPCHSDTVSNTHLMWQPIGITKNQPSKRPYNCDIGNYTQLLVKCVSLFMMLMMTRERN
jgi:hypothetical protein